MLMSMYRRFPFLGKMCALLCCTIFFVLMQQSVVRAAPAGKLDSGNTQNCFVLQVTLHGSQPATSTCVVQGKAQLTSGTVQPTTYVTGCSNAALTIYADHNQSGWTICFIGDGFVNMTDYSGPAPFFAWNWNDNASSFRAGCASGTFYTDTNGNGGQSDFDPHQRGDFPFGNIWDDSLSSIQIYGNCNG